MVDRALIRDPETGTWSQYRNPERIVSAFAVEDVVDAVRRVESAVEEQGFHAVGFIGYEAAPAFDPAHRVNALPEDLPLLSFGLFDASGIQTLPAAETTSDHTLGPWEPSLSREDYRRSIGRIRDHIARGDTYQVNFTFRLRAPFSGDPRSFFLDLVRSQPKSIAAFLGVGDRAICSASPELFFLLDGRQVVSRPMKGTAERGHDLRSDRNAVEGLRTSEKNRAENAMIVDMVRNDLARVAEVGSVRVTSRFDIERHPTVLQMTSTVEAETRTSLTEIMGAVFPFASVTGAPKIRTMELISELEDEPRGVYTGAIGLIRPGRKARFSVGIRTAVVDLAAGEVEYGVGSGVVWDSEADAEYDECLAKARILSEPIPEFDLLETLLWEPDGGFVLLERHLDRLAGAAEYFCRPFDRDLVREELRANPASPLPLRVRLLLAADGSIQIKTAPIDVDPDPAPVQLGLARDPVTVDDPFLHFKTTNRGVYERARASRPDCDDVLLWNEMGEVTESTIANLVARIDGDLVTPPVSSGLLAGTYRDELLAGGEITEKVIRVEELVKAEELFLINSVQGRRGVAWVDR